jgi:hypothetical protein
MVIITSIITAQTPFLRQYRKKRPVRHFGKVRQKSQKRKAQKTRLFL